MLKRSSFPVAMALAVLGLSLAATAAVQAAPELPPDPPEISAGAQADIELQKNPAARQLVGPAGPWNADASRRAAAPMGLVGGGGFLGFGFDDNGVENGTFFIPPDPMGAAGTDRVIAVVNTMIEARTKAGALLWRDALKDFFTGAAGVGAGTLGTFTFDPKVVFDHHHGRFVVVTLERVDATLSSRILLAVSKTATPATATAADWWYWSIDSKLIVGPVSLWADYPGFEVDEEAIYVTANMFNFPGFPGTFDQRLWIVHKGLVGGFYSGGAATVTIHSPYDVLGLAGFKTTTMPAEVHGAPGVGTGIGTYLVAYSGLTFGGPGAFEAINVIRVNDPTAAVTFTQEFVTVGDLEDVGGIFGFPALPDAPQSGTAELIEVNDQRTLDAVWRGHGLWLTTTVNPNAANSPANVGQATAQWIRLSTAGVAGPGSPAGLVVLGDRGVVGGEEITPGLDPVTTFFPSVAVNSLGEAKIGYSASAATIFAGAYVAGRQPADPPGSVQPSLTVHPGLDYYIRTFDGPPCAATPSRNRWGDYTGISIDPVDDRRFWVFNEYADLKGSPTVGGCNGRPDPEDGRWGTAWGTCAFSCFTLTCPPSTLVVPGAATVVDICINNCGPYGESFTHSASDPLGWCSMPAGPTPVPGDASTCVPVTCTVPSGAACGSTNDVVVTVTAPDGTVKTCTITLIVDCSTATQLATFSAEGSLEGIRLRWMFSDEADVASVAIERAGTTLGPWTDVDAQIERAGQMSTALDRDAAANVAQYYRLRVTEFSGNVMNIGLASAVRSGRLEGVFLARPAPNPSKRGADILFRTGQAERIRLNVVDVSGRLVRTLHDGPVPAGEHVIAWDGLSDASEPVAPGVYFIRLSTSAGAQSTRIAILP